MADGRLHAVFSTSADARMALNRLSQDGVSPKDIEVRSSVPLELDVVPVGSKIASRVPWMALTGAVLGGTAFFSLVRITSELYPLPTGGMPIVALPPAGVITFEGVAIGAIVATVATVLYEAALPGLKGPGPLDHHLAEDHILVSVECDADASTAWAAKALETARS
ncbi:MAG TPA: quinol:electron acceptor oxidoreductase subunit ActD [Longimicrobiales bacterium]|nr:quinol:electron acceptor oxidoreductase subunit ActD [Longimicrobiales bacterium]